jgi:arylsulfatase A-like enzyme
MSIRHRGRPGSSDRRDNGIGLLLKTLKHLGLEEDTLVVFTSDNGGKKRKRGNETL